MNADQTESNFIEIVGRLAVHPDWALGATVMLAQDDLVEGEWPMYEPALVIGVAAPTAPVSSR